MNVDDELIYYIYHVISVGVQDWNNAGTINYVVHDWWSGRIDDGHKIQISTPKY